MSPPNPAEQFWQDRPNQKPKHSSMFVSPTLQQSYPPAILPSSNPTLQQSYPPATASTNEAI